MLKEKMNRAKKNTIDFFPGIISSVINDVLIAENERIILFMCSNASIALFIRGNDSNIIAVNSSGEVSGFRGCDDETLDKMKQELADNIFINSFFKPDITNSYGSMYEAALKDKFPTISKDIIREAKYRPGAEETAGLENEITAALKEIENAPAAVMINEDTKEIKLAVSTFKSFPYTSLQEFGTINEALRFYFSKKYYYENLLNKRRLIEKYFKRELPKLTVKLDSLKNRLNTPSREEEYNKKGNLLLIGINQLYKGQKSVTLEDIYTGSGKILIELDETLLPKENIDSYFRKAKSEKVNIEKSKLLYAELFKEFEKLKKYEAAFNAATAKEEYDLIIKELKMEKSVNNNHGKAPEYNFNFKQYLIDKKYRVYVGKDSSNNDLLTTKFARQNDFWFHARSVPGSHVVLRVENTKEAVPKSVLKSAAALAAFHSKAKTASTAPVSYTLKKYVYKKKGMDPGQVALTKEDVLLVKPEIPSNCEYISED